VPRVRDSLSASDLGDVAKREPGRIHQTPQRDLPDMREDLALKGAEIDELSVAGFPLGDLTLSPRGRPPSPPPRLAAVSGVDAVRLLSFERADSALLERLVLLGVHVRETGVAVETLTVGNFPTAAQAAGGKLRPGYGPGHWNRTMPGDYREPRTRRPSPSPARSSYATSGTPRTSGEPRARLHVRGGRLRLPTTSRQHEPRQKEVRAPLQPRSGALCVRCR
jgi:hypothetical protein